MSASATQGGHNGLQLAMKLPHMTVIINS